MELWGEFVAGLVGWSVGQGQANSTKEPIDYLVCVLVLREFRTFVRGSRFFWQASLFGQYLCQ
jgi:hypothetical protein